MIIKDALSRVADAMLRAGLKMPFVLNVLDSAGFETSPGTIYDHVKKLRTLGTTYREIETRGREKLLDDDHIELLIGHVLYANEKNKAVTTKDVQKFCNDEFKVQLSGKTVRRYLNDSGFSSRLLKTKTGGFKLTNKQMAKQILEWLLQNRDKIFQGFDRFKIVSFDFTYTSHMTERPRTYATIGSSQPRLDSDLSRYTNCILTAICADGINRYPSMLFTLNPAFRTDRSNTERRFTLLKELRLLLDEHNIDESRIVYIGKETGENGLYAQETSCMIEHFLAHYKIPKSYVCISDGGNASKEKREDKFVKLGYTNRFIFPASVHQFLSVNDNKVHGVAKQAWRNSGLDYKRDVNSTLALMHQLDIIKSVHIRTWYEENYCLLHEPVRIEDCLALVGSTGKRFSKRHSDALNRYKSEMHPDFEITDPIVVD